MNLFQLVFKQMRQRSLSTWLTLLSVLLGVALAVSVMIIYRQGGDLFVQKNYGYEIIIGAPKGSPLQLVLNTVYQIDVSPGNVPYSVYEDVIKNRPLVKIAVPYAVGDSYMGYRIIGTLPKLFGVDDQGNRLEPEKVLEYQQGKRYELAAGKVFHPEKFEAVIGSDVAQRTGLKVGDTFKATHGMPQPGETPDVHDTPWTVVGVLKPTRTAMDRVLFIPLTSFYAISEHEEGLEEQAALKRQLGGAPTTASASAPAKDHDHEDHKFELRPDGTIKLNLPKEDLQVSAILVKARGTFQTSQILYHYRMIDLRASAVNPADVMRQFINTFLKSSTLVLLMVSLLVIIVASIGILVAIYNSVSARMREIAILRALGATRRRILALICLEAGFIGLAGAVLGAITGHLIAAGGSFYLNRLLGQGIRWLAVDGWEIAALVAVVVLAVLAGLVPALKAYRTPVATNLTAG
jgi:putative ABC transport system permease protein